jgi:hypothetical protein
MKQYHVSLAMLRPMSAEYDCEAESEAHAVRKAIAEFHEGGGRINANWDGDDRLDLADPDDEGQDIDEFGGVRIEEITE